jgi:hypothetical protein
MPPSGLLRNVGVHRVGLECSTGVRVGSRERSRRKSRRFVRLQYVVDRGLQAMASTADVICGA